MEKLSIRQASEKFGISRARLYQLLEKGVIVGHRSMQRGRAAGSWVDSNSLYVHIQNDKQGRPRIMADGDYLPTRLAAQKTGYSISHVNLLVKQGAIAAKKKGNVNLIYYPSLLKYINSSKKCYLIIKKY